MEQVLFDNNDEQIILIRKLNYQFRDIKQTLDKLTPSSAKDSVISIAAELQSLEHNIQALAFQLQDKQDKLLSGNVPANPLTDIAPGESWQVMCAGTIVSMYVISQFEVSVQAASASQLLLTNIGDSPIPTGSTVNVVVWR